VPCVGSLPAGWSLGAVNVKRGRSQFWLDSDQAGHHAVKVTLLPEAACSVDGATEVTSDEPDTRRFERAERLPPGLRTTRSYLFPGGCVTYEFSFAPDAAAALTFAADSALTFQPRRPLVDLVDERTGGLSLCGAGAPPCSGRP
jgi:hypothetical protein